MIRSKDGGWEQYGDCKRGYHEYEWMPTICDYACFFCLDVEAFDPGEGEFDAEDEFMIGPINPRPVKKAAVEEDEGTGSDSDNHVVEWMLMRMKVSRMKVMRKRALEM